MLCSYDISDQAVVCAQAWECSVGIICFPSLYGLAGEVASQLAQEIQKVLVGKPAGECRVALGPVGAAGSKTFRPYSALLLSS